MKCLILLSGKNEKNIISLLSAEFAQRVVHLMVNFITLFQFWPGLYIPHWWTYQSHRTGSTLPS